MVIAACDNSPPQQWSVNSDGTIRSLPSGLSLDAVNRGTTVTTVRCRGRGRDHRRAASVTLLR